MVSRLVLAMTGLSLIASMILVPPSQAQQSSQVCFNKQLPLAQCNMFKHDSPPIGSVYAMNVFGVAFTAREHKPERMSVHLEMNVTGVTGSQLKTVHLGITSGVLKINGNSYSLTRGSGTEVAGYVNLKASSKDGRVFLMASSSVIGSLPVTTSEGSAGLTHARAEKSVTLQILIENLFVDKFSGNMSRKA